ncbi:MAG: hypothetical protein V1914_04295 [archaeon]
MTENKESVLEEHKSHAQVRRSKQNKFWMVSTFILLGVVIALFATNSEYLENISGNTVLSAEEVAEQTVNYLNNNLLTGGIEATITKTDKIDSCLYKIKLDIGPQEFESYVSSDGKYLFPTAVDTTIEIEPPEVPEMEDIPQTDKPVMDMFVMSQCPFGVQAEDAMLEVADILGDKIEYNIHYIVTDNGDGTFRSLHGQPETDEDIRQLCIAAKEPALFNDYLKCLNADYRNAETIWEGCATEAGIDVETLKTCAEGDEGKQLLSDDSIIAMVKGIGGSPTIEINGVGYNGARSANALKIAMCDAFTTAPEECEEALSTGSEAAGNC